MRTASVLLIIIAAACTAPHNSFESDPRFTQGRHYETGAVLPPKISRFHDYTFITGYPDDNGRASMGLFLDDKEVFYEEMSDGDYDTIMAIRYNNDNITDFLVSQRYEDGASLYALVSRSDTAFEKRPLLDDWTGVYCIEGGDTLIHFVPIMIKDLNSDGTEDIVVNAVKQGRSTYSISCTQTLLTGDK